MAFSEASKNCEAKIKIIGAKDISEKPEYLRWERPFRDAQRADLQIHSSSLGEYVEKVNGYLEKNPTQTEIRHGEENAQQLNLLYALSNQNYVYFCTGLRYQLAIPCPPFRIRLSLSGDSLEKNLDFKIEIKSLSEIRITPVDC